MDNTSLFLFIIACLSINLIPGPDVIYIISNSMKGRKRDGMQAALGLGLGYIIHIMASCLGLSAIIVNSAITFTAIKWLGAAYLVYLGIQSLISMWKGQTRLTLDKNTLDNKNVFIQGAIVSTLNPKVALFFLSFLPQFIDLYQGSTSNQLLMLGLLFSVLATLCNLVYAMAGNWLLSNKKSENYSRWLEGLSGFLLIGLAGKIVLDQR
ncbi:LysE family translocator [Alteromonas sp. 5E99-2]|uniref:LysE family translocator n=1 Tax=Alteromonas sp. 5E99-2 TaxID=2817683 RepID=UPI001A98B5A7|nr:LysE family translocator [Alteromonas sp. 5E99-2]MBO1256599.1 LysE family translocator [Alteromonas sp. 5E99-2]